MDVNELRDHCGGLDASYAPVMSRSDLKAEYGGRILFVGHGASCLGIVEAFDGSGYVEYSSPTHFSHAVGSLAKARSSVRGAASHRPVDSTF